MNRIDPTLPDPADDDVFERVAALDRHDRRAIRLLMDQYASAERRFGFAVGAVAGAGIATIAIATLAWWLL